MKDGKEVTEILEAFDLTGSFRAAGELAGCSPNTVAVSRPSPHRTTTPFAGFNREELLRPIPPDDPDHARLMGRRNDTESGNRLLDDSMLRERAHTVGRRRQLLNLITWAALRNSSAAHQHAPSTASDPPALAA